MPFIKLVILIFSVYLVFRLFALYIAPWLLRLFLKRIQKNFFEQNVNVQNFSDSKEGNITIHKVKDNKDNDIPKDLGDYVDYEEVKNNQNPTDE